VTLYDLRRNNLVIVHSMPTISYTFVEPKHMCDATLSLMTLYPIRLTRIPNRRAPDEMEGVEANFGEIKKFLPDLVAPTCHAVCSREVNEELW